MTCAVLESPEDQLDGAVDFSSLRCVEAAREVSEAAGVDGSHLVDQHQGPGAVHLDLGAEDCGLCAGGCRGDDEGGEQDRVALDRDCIPRAALLLPDADRSATARSGSVNYFCRTGRGTRYCCSQASRSALMVAACVVGMPCG